MGEKRKLSDDNTLRVFTIDSFSSVPFAGNPAGVCLDDTPDGLPDTVMQKIAAEMNLSDTAFVKKLKNEDTFQEASTFKLCWFTPTSEVPLCGHATLATAAVLFNILGNSNSSLEFQTRHSGVLKAKKIGTKIALDLPQNPPEPFDRKEVEDLIKEVIGDLEVQDVQLTPGGFPGLVIRVADKYTQQDIASLKPNVEKFMSVETTGKVKGVILTLKGGPNNGCTDPQGVQFDCASRYFSPWNGIIEDHVCGAAHTTLAPYWAKELGKSQLYARQCSARGGELWLSLREEGRVDVSGYATVVMEGTMNYM